MPSFICTTCGTQYVEMEQCLHNLPGASRYKHGMHSKYLPKHLQADYQRAVTDPELLSLQSQIALLAARELELTRQLAEMESPPWGQAVDALVDFELAVPLLARLSAAAGSQT